MATERHDCEHCSEHQVNTLKIKQTCEKLDKLGGKVDGLDDELHGSGDKLGLHTQVALLNQKLENLKWPVLIITAAALANLAKMFFPMVRTVVGG